MTSRWLLCASFAGALLILALVTTAPTAGARDAAGQGRFALRGVVTTVVDGDTIDARLDGGRRERVRLIGIDTPERGDCFFSEASARTRALALGRRVVLRGDATQDTRDRYGRLLAYADVGGSNDLGRALIRGGHAEVYVYRRPFKRVASYRAAESAARGAAAGRWHACVAPAPAPPPSVPPPATRRCDPSYPTVCIAPPPPDLDCKDVPYRNFPVVGADPHRFDGNRDGRGCESFSSPAR
jgi:micrococcal nuclease